MLALAYTIGPAATERPNDRERLLSLHRKEGARRHYWIAAKPAGVTMKSLDDCVLGFDLGPQATQDHAVTVADFLNQNILDAITRR
jgi:hypothetical protein